MDKKIRMVVAVYVMCWSSCDALESEGNITKNFLESEVPHIIAPSDLAPHDVVLPLYNYDVTMETMAVNSAHVMLRTAISNRLMAYDIAGLRAIFRIADNLNYLAATYEGDNDVVHRGCAMCGREYQEAFYEAYSNVLSVARSK